MTTQDDLDQQLWDYVFGLLEPEEARALEGRITSEHDVARAYSEVRQRADMLGAAARLEIPPIKLSTPREDVTTVARSRLVSGGPQWGSWFMTSAALALMALTGYAWQRHGWLRDSQSVARVEKTMAADFRRVIVTGPAELKPHASNLFTVQMEDLNGAAVSDEFCVKVRAGEQERFYEGKANHDGIGHVTVDGGEVQSSATLSAWSLAAPEIPPVELKVTRADATYATYFAMNQPTYKPGDIVLWRSVSLPQPASSTTREFNLGCQTLSPLGEPVANTAGLTQNGVANGKFQLPEDAAAGRYSLLLSSADSELPRQEIAFVVGDSERMLASSNAQLAEQQPAVTKAKDASIGVHFYAEGGKLVPGLTNKLYFEALDEKQQPVAIAGKIVDSQQNEITTLSTLTGGRGEVEFTPRQDESYFFSFRHMAPKAAQDAAPLPPVESDVTAKLSATAVIISAGEAIDLDIATTKTPTQLLVAAHCNGELVGQQFVEFDAKASRGTASQHLALPITDTAAGVVNVSLYDLNEAQPREIALQPVYRQPAHYLKLALERVTPSNSDSDRHVDWLVRVQDEQDRPCRATLGINVVKETSSPEAARSPSLLAAWYLPPGGPQGLMGRRRWDEFWDAQETEEMFGSVTEMDFAGGQTTLNDLPAITQNVYHYSATLGDHDPQDRFARLTTLPPPAIADNLAEAEAAFRRAVTQWSDREQARLRAFAVAICVGSLAMLMALALLLTLRAAGRAIAWIPALGSSVAALLIATSWTGVRIEPSLQVAARPVPSFDGAAITNRGFLGRGLGSGGLGGEQPSGSGAGFGGGGGGAGIDGTVNASDPLTAAPIINLPEEAAAGLGPTQSTDAPSATPAEAAPKPVPLEALAIDELNAPLRELEDRLGLGVVAEPLPPLVAGVHVRPADTSDLRFEEKPSPVQRLAQQPSAYTQLPVHRWGDLETSDDTAKPAGTGSTLYWNPLLETNDQGEARLRFAVPPGVRYRIVIDAHGSGRVGSLIHQDKTPPIIQALPGPPSPP